MATQTGKKYKAAAEKVDRNKRYTIAEGFKLLKETTEIVKMKYDQTIDVAINLGIDPKHADQMVRGAVVLPIPAFMASRGEWKTLRPPSKKIAPSSGLKNP